MCACDPAHRFDPARCAGDCPSCGAIVGAPPGQPTTIHQGPDGGTCPGTGRPAV
ncbi:hypothetical protein [Streptomyces sp. DH12]|uniref:hypothetical protein n=1 Tax=Streptomyces sp. DH12 TaxID=2857010 RepID=UPI001E408C26|nr:hypothetical protein [Streptomyces sp. DH12]